jgi:hypothetical protein
VGGRFFDWDPETVEKDIAHRYVFEIFWVKS